MKTKLRFKRGDRVQIAPGDDPCVFPAGTHAIVSRRLHCCGADYLVRIDGGGLWLARDDDLVAQGVDDGPR